jgi:hypothetical protein
MGSRIAGVPKAAADAAREGVANALAAAPSAGPQAGVLARAARESFVTGWQQAMWAGAAVLGALFVYVLLRGPQRSDGVGGDVPDSGPEEAGRLSDAVAL